MLDAVQSERIAQDCIEATSGVKQAPPQKKLKEVGIVSDALRLTLIDLIAHDQKIGVARFNHHIDSGHLNNVGANSFVHMVTEAIRTGTEANL